MKVPLLLHAAPSAGAAIQEFPFEKPELYIQRSPLYQVDKLKVPPHKIMAVTFTNKAAREMKLRVEKLLEGRLRGKIGAAFVSAGLGAGGGAELDLLLDDPQGARDIPRAAETAGHHVVAAREEAGLWRITIEA